MADLNIIIADDTPSIRQGLKTVIKENAAYADILGIFSDGQSVLNYIKDNAEKINAAILDIQMPYVSGLDIAEYIYENNIPISVVIISGYREFDYAKRAISSHVFKFVCKPVVFQELITTLDEIRKNTHLMLENKNRIEETKKLAMQSCLNSARLLYDTNDIYGFKPLIDFFPKNSGEDFIITELKTENEQDIIDFNDSDFAFLVDKKEDFSIYLAMPNALKDNGGFEIINTYSGIENCLFCRRVTLAAKNFVKSVRELNHDAKILSLNELIKYLSSDFETAKKFILKYMQEKFGMSKENLCLIEDKKDPTEFVKTAEGIILASFSDKERLVENVKLFIKENFCYDMSLNLAAEHFGVSVGYLSRTFKEITGMLFIKYLTEVRIQKAIHLMNTTNKSLNDIAKEVGYDSNKNFRMNFKKITGLLPNQYVYMQRRKD
mgnify:CR=1 FL=1